jgi:hypothetical protein
MGKATLFVKRRIKRGRHQTIPTGRRVLRSKSLFPRRRINIVKGRRSLYKIRTPLPRPFRRIRAPWLQATRALGKYVRKFAQPEDQWSAIKRSSWSPSKSVSIRKSSFGTPKRKKVYGKRPPRTKKDTEVFGLGFDYYKWHQKPKTMEPHWFHPKREIFKVPERRGGKRDLSHVIYPDYGLYPKHIDPHLIFAIRPTNKFLIAMMDRRKTHTDAQFIARMTKLYLDSVRVELLSYAKKIIGKYVPKDTGKLQKVMYKSLEDCKRTGYILRIRLSAKVDHAGVVNEMPEVKVRHHSNMRRRSRHTNKFLHDPLAQKTSYTYIMMLLKEKAGLLIYDMITQMVLMWNKVPKKIQPTLNKPLTFPTQRRQSIAYQFADPTMEDAEKSMRYAKMRENINRPDKKPSVPINRNLIKGYFRIDGLYKKKKR